MVSASEKAANSLNTQWTSTCLGLSPSTIKTNKHTQSTHSWQVIYQTNMKTQVLPQNAHWKKLDGVVHAFSSNTKTRGSLGLTGHSASLLCEFQATERANLRTTTETSNSLQENQTKPQAKTTWKAPRESTCGSLWLPHKPVHTRMSSSVAIYT